MKIIRKYVKREKRILLLMPEYVMGGAETQFRYLIDYAEKAKWKLDIVIEHRFKSESNVLKNDKLKKKNVRFYEISGKLNDTTKIKQYLIKHILTNCLHVKYGVCLIYIPADLALVRIMSSLGIRVIYSERIDAEVIKDNKYYQKCLRYCTYVLGNSQYAKKELEKLTGKKVGLIRNGRPVVSLLPVKKNRNIHRILVPGRIIARKNQIMLLYYLRSYSDFQGKIFFAGRIEDKMYYSKLQTFIKRNHLQERIEFLGNVADMCAEYEKADLVVLPSLSEGTPNVVLEAYAYGRPVIVSDIEMEKDIVKNPNLRFSLSDIDEIDRCIKYVQTLSDEEYVNMLEDNRKFVLENYSIEKMTKKFYKILKTSE